MDTGQQPATVQYAHLRESSQRLVDRLAAEFAGAVDFPSVVHCVSGCEHKVHCTCTSLAPPVRAGIVESLARTRLAVMAAELAHVPDVTATNSSLLAVHV